MAKAVKGSATPSKAQKVVASGLMSRDEVKNTVKAEREKNRSKKVAERETKKSKKTEQKTVSVSEQIIELVNSIKTAEEYKQVLACFKEAMEIRKGAFVKQDKPKKSSAKGKKTEAKAKNEEPKKSDRPQNEYGKVFQGVPQIMSLTAKVRKEIKIEKYSEKCYTLTTPKSLHDVLFGCKKQDIKGLLSEFKWSFSDEKGFYWLPQSRAEKVGKILGIKIA